MEEVQSRSQINIANSISIDQYEIRVNQSLGIYLSQSIADSIIDLHSLRIWVWDMDQLNLTFSLLEVLLNLIISVFINDKYISKIVNLQPL